MSALTTGAARTAAALATVALLGGGALMLAGRTGPAAPGATASPAPSPIDLSAWSTFTSARYGISFRVPPGWTVSPAHPTGPLPMGPDEVRDRDGAARFIVTSSRLPSMGAPVPGVDWWTIYLEFLPDGSSSPGCDPWRKDAYDAVNVDGQDGHVLFSAACGYGRAIVFAGGRLYELTAWPGLVDGAPNAAALDGVFFEAWLSSVRLLPSAAVDALPSPSPVPSP
jgi:hypothetical protein